MKPQFKVGDWVVVSSNRGTLVKGCDFLLGEIGYVIHTDSSGYMITIPECKHFRGEKVPHFWLDHRDGSPYLPTNKSLIPYLKR